MRFTLHYPLLLAITLVAIPAVGAELELTLRYQQETAAGSGRYHRLTRPQAWRASETALIVCDAWDLHHSEQAVRRLEEFAPRLNEVVTEARRRGVTIIHAPSDCMAAYAEHPARLRAIETPQAPQLPENINTWCSRIPAEEQVVYPIDQSDGGEDDDPEQKRNWSQHLKQLGRDPAQPWKQQTDLIKIDPQHDYISDRGDEVWNILQHHGIENVILSGVHLNMCVLGRPFGLRQMASHGKHVVLMRDMTDTMYNPAMWPYVSHFTGTDLMIDHVERFVCPTITSDQLIGGDEFVFAQDTRPHLVIVMAEEEYDTDETLPKFAAEHLGKDFRVSLIYADRDNRNQIIGLEQLAAADLALISVRRRTPPADQLKRVRDFTAAGKPVLGIRTANHAFSLRRGKAPSGQEAWPEFDAEVFGGNYTGHHSNRRKSTVHVVEKNAEHPVLTGIEKSFPQAGTLYKVSPLSDGTVPLLMGTADGVDDQPLAWTFKRSDGGQSFYTSLGHPADFENDNFVRLLVGAVYWAAGLKVPEERPTHSVVPHREPWTLVTVPASVRSRVDTLDGSGEALGWYRCTVRIPSHWLTSESLELRVPTCTASIESWFNSHRLRAEPSRGGATSFRIPSTLVETDDANWLVLRFAGVASPDVRCAAPELVSGDRQLTLAGRWQHHTGETSRWVENVLPARYGGAPDILFAPRSAP